MADKKGKTAGAAPKKENRSKQDHVRDEEAQANREGQGATAGAAPGQGFVRCYMEDDIPANAEIREYERMKREQKKKREEERMANPDILFMSTRCSEEDKLQFYSKKREEWLKLIRELNPKKTIISIKLETSKGTIMSYSSGEFVISGSETQRNDFKTWFQNKSSLRNLTEKMEKMEMKNHDPNHQPEL